jgi:HlyD family secretion protein
MLKNKLFIGALILIGAISVVAMVTASKPGGTSADAATFKVAKGPLTISVIESGTIKAREQIIIKNEVEGRTSLIYLIPEGTRVTKGELLVELDASTLEDDKIDQEIVVQNADADWVNTTENLAVAKNQAQSDIELAELTLEFAKQDLKKYIEGDYPNELKQADGEITLADEELKRAQETLKWSDRLYKEKYISETELQADQLNEKRRALDLEMANNKRDLLTNFQYQRNLAQFESDVSQAEMALERTNRKAKADVVQAEAKLMASKAKLDRETDKLNKIQDQIGKTKIYAPADGLVIYATSARTGGFRGSEEPLEEGQEVRERQELIYLPTANASKAEIDLHESNLEKVEVGLRAVVSVDALNAQRFPGSVARIAPLPNAQSMWMNPDLKVYTTEINIENNNESLRTGMSCEAEILVAQYPDVFYVPIQAVLRVKGQPTIFAYNGKTFEPRTVETGLDNNVMIHIKSGIQEGDIVLLTPPLKEGKKTETVAAFEPGEATPATGLEPRPSFMDDTTPTDANSQPRRRERRNTPSEQIQNAPESPDGTQTPGQEQMRRRFENMTDAEREEMRKRFENMSEEERQQMRQRRGSNTGGTQ